MWLRRLMEELTCEKIKKPTILLADNQGAIALAKNASQHGCTKHIDIQQQFMREKPAETSTSASFPPRTSWLMVLPSHWQGKHLYSFGLG